MVDPAGGQQPRIEGEGEGIASGGRGSQGGEIGG